MDVIRYLRALKYTLKKIDIKLIVLLLIVKFIKWCVFLFLMWFSYHIVENNIDFYFWAKKNLNSLHYYYVFLVLRILIFYSIALIVERIVASIILREDFISVGSFL